MTDRLFPDSNSVPHQASEPQEEIVNENTLRNASLGLQIVAMTGMSSLQLRAAVAAQSYAVHAHALGVDDAESQRVLSEVVDELRATGSRGDQFAIASRRLAEGSNFRPPEPLREAARQMLAAGGYSLHPEHVDAHAWQLQHVIDAYAPTRVRWYRRAWCWLRKALWRRAR